MPEGLEAEIWRRASQDLIGRTISAASVDERVAPESFVERVVGRTVESARRSGKVVLLETDGPTIGLHFGMTGRLVIDGRAPIDRLEYASAADRPEWDRLTVHTTPPGSGAPAVRLNDPRRLGRVSLDPDLGHLGPDALTLTKAELTAGLAGRRRAVKALLLDQTVVAGLGNLCVDEVLFWAGVAPRRQADSLGADELAAIADACRRRLPAMLERGGSTCGTLDPSARAALPACPRCDAGRLVKAEVGGRTAVWCDEHQR